MPGHLRASPSATARPGAIATGPQLNDNGSPPGGRHTSIARRRLGSPGEIAVGTPRRVLAAGPQPRPGLERFVAPRIGLDLPGRLGFGMWLRIGRQLEAVASSSAWCLGDWLSYGRAAYAGRYRDAVEQTSLDYQTLRNYAWVAGRFPLSRRRDTLSFGHHAEVAALPEPEQDFWLRKAGDLGWSRNHLRREVRASLRERQADPPLVPAPRPASSPRNRHVGWAQLADPAARRRRVGCQNSAMGLDRAFYALRSYLLIRPPRTGRRLIRSRERSATGWSGRGGRSWR